jgi:hypothetical protein
LETLIEQKTAVYAIGEFVPTEQMKYILIDVLTAKSVTCPSDQEIEDEIEYLKADKKNEALTKPKVPLTEIQKLIKQMITAVKNLLETDHITTIDNQGAAVLSCYQNLVFMAERIRNKDDPWILRPGSN